MIKAASKLDWLKERKDFKNNAEARAATRLLEHKYAPHGDALYPWMLRELKRGNIDLPLRYRESWLKIVESEIAAERELARRHAWVDQRHQEGASDYEPLPESWSDDDGKIDWEDIENAPWNKLTDYLDSFQREDPEGGTWGRMHGTRGMAGLVPYTHLRTREGPDQITRDIEPEDLKLWDQVLADRAKRRKGVDPMQFSASDFRAKMENEWAPEYDSQVRQNYGDVVHQFPDKWSVRKLKDSTEAELEGQDMGHCAGGYGDWIENGKTHVFSLRDPNNRPHATVEIKPDQWRGKGVPREMFERHGVEEPPAGYSSYVDSVHHMLENQLHDPHYQGLQQRTDPNEMASKLWRIAEELKAQRAGEVPWHGGSLQQVQGKENQAPNAEYQDRLRQWFGTWPEEALPSNLEETPYHPEAIPSYWSGNRQGWGGAFGQEQDADQLNLDPIPEPHLAHDVHYPAPAHKNWATGEICHCGFGPERGVWSWHKSGHMLYSGDANNRRIYDGATHARSRRDERRASRAGALSPAQRPVRGAVARGHRRGDLGQSGLDHTTDSGRPPNDVGLLAGSRRRRQSAARWSFASQELEGIIDAFGEQHGATLLADEDDNTVSMNHIELPEDQRGQGIGSRLMAQIKSYCDRNNKALLVTDVVNRPFFAGLGWMNFQPPDRFIYAPPQRLGTVDSPACPTCGEPMQGRYGTFCPRCQWSEMDANLDSDPLSNPPDPTVDMHRGVQANSV